MTPKFIFPCLISILNSTLINPVASFTFLLQCYDYNESIFPQIHFSLFLAQFITQRPWQVEIVYLRILWILASRWDSTMEMLDEIQEKEKSNYFLNLSIIVSSLVTAVFSPWLWLLLHRSTFYIGFKQQPLFSAPIMRTPNLACPSKESSISSCCCIILDFLSPDSLLKNVFLPSFSTLILSLSLALFFFFLILNDFYSLAWAFTASDTQ